MQVLLEEKHRMLLKARKIAMTTTGWDPRVVMAAIEKPPFSLLPASFLLFHHLI